MKTIEKLMNEYFDCKSKYSYTLSKIFDDLCDKWLKSDLEKKINLLDEDGDAQSILCPYYSDETLYPQRLEVEFLNDDTYLNLYVKNQYHDEEFILDEKEWISEHDVIAFLIEQIAMYLGYDLDANFND